MTDIIQKLLEHSTDYAKELLIDTKEFYPFGAYIDTIDNVHPLEFDYNKKIQPTVSTVLESLTKYCENEMTNDRMKAYALVFESEVQLEEDQPKLKCITVQLIDKVDKKLPTFYIPYHISNNQEVSFDEMFGVTP
ncbi:MAG TPA: hypothetical protein EYG85_03430 [Crocinitomix sp.]|nr:hypothetical protein [Crocinitomix sp.]